MLLAIDAGNTNIVFAVFDAATRVGMWRLTTLPQRPADEYAVFLKGLMRESGLDPARITASVLGSVVPDATFHLANLCREHFGAAPLIVGTPEVATGIRVLLDRPEEVGADRVINAVAGAERYKLPLLIVDFGTATTFDLVDEQGDYRGGVIAPGANLSLQALHMAAARLPRVAVSKPARVIGTNTVDAMKSGIFWGYVGMIEGIVARAQMEFGSPLTVVATGGLAPLFKDSVPVISHLDPDLTLRGLRLIFERNAAKGAAVASSALRSA